jgi:tRNA pseudouridine55 synthase
MQAVNLENINQIDLPEEGIILFDKPKGKSSFYAVAVVRAKLKAQTGRKIKVGHTGTLDPIATGLLILLTGKMTKQADTFLKKDKVYIAEATLGFRSSTYDGEGKITKFKPPPGLPLKREEIKLKAPILDEIEAAAQQFVGKIEQIPPIFSAIKVGGKRAYSLARAGEDVKLKPRQVEIYSLEILDYSFPKLKFRVHVSSGTYIRSLINDIGQKLGCGAYMSELRRIQIGEYKIDE